MSLGHNLPTGQESPHLACDLLSSPSADSWYGNGSCLEKAQKQLKAIAWMVMRASLGRNKTKKISWVEGQENQPKWVEQEGKGILISHWHQEGEKSIWFPCSPGSGCSRNLCGSNVAEMTGQRKFIWDHGISRLFLPQSWPERPIWQKFSKLSSRNCTVTISSHLLCFPRGGPP